MEAKRKFLYPYRLKKNLSLGIIVDDQDKWLLEQFNWWICDCKGYKYAKRQTGSTNNRKSYYLHRQILYYEESFKLYGLDIHHINHNGLDNRRNNLAVVTRAEHIAIQKRIAIQKGVMPNDSSFSTKSM
jgi:hypothetical protein